MIYSFLSREFNQKLGVFPDLSYEREYQGNTFDFYLMEGVFIAEEIEHCYDDKDIIREIKHNGVENFLDLPTDEKLNDKSFNERMKNK